MPAVEIFRPKRNAPFCKRARFIQSKRVKLVGEIAGGKLRAVERIRRKNAPKENRKQRGEQQQQRNINARKFRVGRMWGRGCGLRIGVHGISKRVPELTHISCC